MPKIDTSLDIVGLIAIVALVAPPLTSIIENICKLISKKMDYRHSFYENEFLHKRELFEKFLDISGSMIYDRQKNIEDLVHTYYSLIPYISQEDSAYFRKYCELLQEDDSSEAHNEASKLLNEKIVPCIKKELRRRRPLRK